MLSSAETNVDEDDGDDGQMKTVDKNTGCSLQSVFNVQETERERERERERSMVSVSATSDRHTRGRIKAGPGLSP